MKRLELEWHYHENAAGHCRPIVSVGFVHWERCSWHPAFQTVYLELGVTSCSRCRSQVCRTVTAFNEKVYFSNNIFTNLKENDRSLNYQTLLRKKLLREKLLRKLPYIAFDWAPTSKVRKYVAQDAVVTSHEIHFNQQAVAPAPCYYWNSDWLMSCFIYAPLDRNVHESDHAITHFSTVPIMVYYVFFWVTFFVFNVHIFCNSPCNLQNCLNYYHSESGLCFWSTGELASYRHPRPCLHASHPSHQSG